MINVYNDSSMTSLKASYAAGKQATMLQYGDSVCMILVDGGVAVCIDMERELLRRFAGGNLRVKEVFPHRTRFNSRISAFCAETTFFINKGYAGVATPNPAWGFAPKPH